MMNEILAILPKELQNQIKEVQFQQQTAGTEIERGGKKILIPENMTTDAAIEYLTRKRDEEENYFDFSEVFDAFPLDAAHALKVTLENEFGVTITTKKVIQTLFGPMEINCQMVNCQTGPHSHTPVPWGVIVVPGIEGSMETSFAKKDGRVVMSINGQCKGKHREKLFSFFDDVRKTLRENSIYKGKAIKLNFRDSDGDRLEIGRDPHWQPEFIDLASAEEAIYNQETHDQIEVALLQAIRYTDRLRERGIPVGRKVLLEGDYGTGKTLTAALTAKECVQNDWTFLYVTDVRDIDQAMDIARQYSPCVVFVEDVDHVNDHGDRTVQVLSTALDGVENKDREVMVVMTTNHVNKIPTILKRPGRMDAIVHVGRPNADTTVRLVEHYAGGVLAVDSEDDIKEALEAVAGQSASFVREVVERAKLSAIRNEDGSIDVHDLKTAASMMKHHAQVLNGSFKPESASLHYAESAS